MKKIFLSLLVVTSLSGCALFDAYFMAGYDTTEYALVNKIKTKADLSVEDCKDAKVSKQNMNDLYFVAVEMKNFSTNIPRNEDTAKLAGNLENSLNKEKIYMQKILHLVKHFVNSSYNKLVALLKWHKKS